MYKASRFFVCLVLIWVVCGPSGHSQVSVRDYSNPRYPFVRHDLNLIDNNYRGLRSFYHQLELLDRGEVRKVNIVHIGDSHIQADWFSGTLRKALQREFGAAGRGLVFPYSVANTNGPGDLSASSNVRWRSRRNAQSVSSQPTGVSGFSLRTQNAQSLLRFSVKEPSVAGFDYQFNKITFLTDRGPENFDLQVSHQPIAAYPSSPAPSSGANPDTRETFHLVEKGETLGLIAAKYRLSIQQLKDLNRLNSNLIYAGQRLLISRSKVLSDLPEPSVPSPTQSGNTPVILQLSQPSESFATTLYLDEATRDLYLQTDHTHSLQNRLTLYGMVLENYHQTGILYHSIGVNGATFSDFNDAELFMTQLQALQPDLIIISLGTNETVNWSFPVTGFFREVDQLVHALQQHNPHADILFTTPPDAFRAGKAPNEEIVKAEETLLNYSLSNDLACWDLYQIMGGAASVQSWYGAGLAQRDRLHFTRAGYELQGKLLFEALINGYGSFRSAK